MSALKGTKTEKNLLEAFAGESMARNKYSYFASVAKKEGYEQISAIFQETADNEKEHAKLHLKALQGIGNTMDNLRAAAAGENEEWTDMYPRMAQEARDEGFDDLARLFENIGHIEKAHQERYERILKAVEAGTIFSRAEERVWKCRNCGFLLNAKAAPAICPVCDHPKAHFEIEVDTF
jgi:rubrerythrin